MTLRTPSIHTHVLSRVFRKTGTPSMQGSGHHVASSWEKVLQSALAHCSFFPAQELPPEGQKLGVGTGIWGRKGPGEGRK